ncbi:hypothetical protein [Staphylococcus ratti]|uniref:Uncharacterized protein n=1 Tax=Staphylococcus ratti TaxID=2892440 RepID=A0ABY3PDX1_9STAP|nr:hypothetical protein [Staphylococcus ratti]UEX90518.1 hypothetical protein LN051_02295 [Staphylococcus ratti]
MEKRRLIRGLVITLLLSILFYVMNTSHYQGQWEALLWRTLLFAIVFYVLYVLVFSIFSSEERKRQYGTPSIFGVIVGLLIGIWLDMPLVGLLLGLLFALIVGYFIGFNKRRN